MPELFPKPPEQTRSLSLMAINEMLRAIPRVITGSGVELKKFGDRQIVSSEGTFQQAAPILQQFIVLNEHEDYLECVSFSFLAKFQSYDPDEAQTLLDNSLNGSIVCVAKPIVLQQSPYCYDWHNNKVYGIADLAVHLGRAWQSRADNNLDNAPYVGSPLWIDSHISVPLIQIVLDGQPTSFKFISENKRITIPGFQSGDSSSEPFYYRSTKKLQSITPGYAPGSVIVASYGLTGYYIDSDPQPLPIVWTDINQDGRIWAQGASVETIKVTGDRQSFFPNDEDITTQFDAVWVLRNNQYQTYVGQEQCPIWFNDLSGARYMPNEYVEGTFKGIEPGGPPYIALTGSIGQPLSNTTYWRPTISNPLDIKDFPTTIFDPVLPDSGTPITIVDTPEVRMFLVVHVVDADSSITSGELFICDDTGTNEFISLGGGTADHNTTNKYNSTVTCKFIDVIGAAAGDTVSMEVRIYPNGTLRSYLGSTYFSNIDTDTTPPSADWNNIVGTLSYLGAYSEYTTYQPYNYVQEERLVYVGTSWVTNLTLTISTLGKDFQIVGGGSEFVFRLPDAAIDARGLVNVGTQTWKGPKTVDGSFFVTTSLYVGDPGGDYSLMTPTYTELQTADGSITLESTSGSMTEYDGFRFFYQGATSQVYVVMNANLGSLLLFSSGTVDTYYAIWQFGVGVCKGQTNTDTFQFRGGLYTGGIPVIDEVPAGVINGVNQAFTLAHGGARAVQVYVDGLRTLGSALVGVTLTVPVPPTVSISVDYYY